MRVRSGGLTVVLALMALVLYGCAGSDRGMGMGGEAGMARNVREDDHSPYCKWHFTRQKSGPKSVAVKETFTIDEGPCTVEESDTICVGKPGGTCYEIKSYKDLRGLDFISSGSCRYCYINTFGGVSCVVYSLPGVC
jgi:hypothetical protein